MIYLAQQYFDEKAKQNPKKIAATFNDEKISYGTLGEHSNQLAHAFKRAGVERGDRVCFCLYKSINSIKAILGILPFRGRRKCILLEDRKAISGFDPEII